MTAAEKYAYDAQKVGDQDIIDAYNEGMAKWNDLKEQLNNVLENYTDEEVAEGVANEDIVWKVKHLMKYEVSKL